MAEVTVYADYVCPYCLLAEQSLLAAIGERDISIRWRAFELRPDPVPTLRPEDDYLQTVWRQSVYPMAKQMGVPIQLPTLSPQPRTDKAFELLAMAEDQGLAHAYSMRLLRAFFQEDRDIGQVNVLVELAAEVGLDPAAARQALEQGIYTARHQEALRHAREERVITSVPTLVIGEQVFQGVPSVAKLQQAIALLDEALD
ncbi:MAG: DsbA family oxidoreductase [Neisseriaceae bacterium]|nr:DsbA family oxidoreductase [Neisseriaceae bacterium]